MNVSKITRDFGDLAFYTEGSGPYLLGLSGFGCDHYNFIDLVPELKKNFTIVLIDNRATGKSSGTKKDYLMKDLAEDALAVMDHLNVKTFGVGEVIIKNESNRILELLEKDNWIPICE